MDSVARLHEELRAIAAMLDSEAATIRDIPLEPSRENIRHIGEALSAIYEILRAIYAIRPELTPTQLQVTGLEAEANRRLTRSLGQALGKLDQGFLSQAIAELEAYLLHEQSQLHRSIAERELVSIKKRRAT